MRPRDTELVQRAQLADMPLEAILAEVYRRGFAAVPLEKEEARRVADSDWIAERAARFVALLNRGRDE